MALPDGGHRPGSLKQQNKSHKHGKHRSKGDIDRMNCGRVEVKTLTKRIKKELRKNDRRHRAKTIRRNKRDAVLMEKRNLGGRDSPPHLIAVIPLHGAVSCLPSLALLRTCQPEVVLSENLQHPHFFGLFLPRLKQRFSVIGLDGSDLHAILDAAKVADTLLLLLHPLEVCDATGERTLSCLFAQGLPSYVLATPGASAIPLKRRSEARRNITRHMDRRFPGTRSPLNLDSEMDAVLLLRQAWEQRRRCLSLRRARPYLLAHHTEFQSGTEPGGLGTLCITGYVRGSPMDVNGLIHITGYGDFQLNQIDALDDPLPFNPQIIRKCEDIAVSAMEESGKGSHGSGKRVVATANPALQASLISEAVPDPMDGEQTWPTEEEMKEADALKTKKTRKRVPKGTSEYQAAWIIDSEESECSDDENSLYDVDDHVAVEAVSQGEESDDGISEATDDIMMSVGESARDDNYDEDLDMEAERCALEAYRAERLEEMFPDEMDTPMDLSARVRFQKYRGLQSFRTSPWDPKENLPMEYARIFQFRDFFASRKRVLRSQAEAEGALPGWYVTIHIPNVPSDLLEDHSAKSPLVIFGLLPHEQKMSVMHVAVRKHPEFTEPLRSKEELIFHVAWRRFRACPILSQHTPGDKYKYERFFRSEAPMVMSVYAPIMYPPGSVLVFQNKADGVQELVATGSILRPDPDRIVAKRVVLSGHPYKIHPKTAVIRYMFFHREDILWFKPIELRTKWGRRGHIKEPLGTHGHMKCVFSGSLKSQDTVLMNLYKRVFPKWTYDPHVPTPAVWYPREKVAAPEAVEGMK
uniref:pre-rRNA-processing protein TSR1 homolog isoform X2 n=1 Tax=Myxine glutinosa TaxID=7769 RepID=UPI00358E9302